MISAEYIIFRIGYPLRQLYWFIFRPRTQSVKCLIECKGRFLLVRSTYWKKYWTFPGGRVKVRPPYEESPMDAAQRLLKDEVGINIDKLISLGEYFTSRRYMRDVVFCFYAKPEVCDAELKGVDVLEVRWFPPDQLPRFQSPTIEHVLRLYKEKDRHIRNLFPSSTVSG